MLLERDAPTRLTRACVALAMFATACDRGHHEAPAPQPPPAPAPAAPSEPKCTLAPLPLKVAGAKRIVAVGDVHGDLSAARAALETAGAIDESDHWIGKDLIIVQTGDVLDRGNDESKILELFDRLAGEAAQSGGAFLQLLGNHELMNAAADFRYVTPGGHHDFSGERARELAPGGTWAKRLAHHDVVAIVGDTVFSHAGVLASWAPRLDAMNLETRCWLDGQLGDAHHPASALASDDSPVWTRVYGVPGAVDCAELSGVLATLGAKRMVVAHTVQEHGITSDCDGKLWRIDVGMTAMFGGPIQVLEIAGDAVKPLEGKR